MATKDIREGFWAWVGGRRAGDNPRGDFIRDTQEALARGLDPDTLLNQVANERAEKEHDLLWCRYARENNLSPEVVGMSLRLGPGDDDDGDC